MGYKVVQGGCLSRVDRVGGCGVVWVRVCLVALFGLLLGNSGYMARDG
jgi:hypothetical protein